VEGGKAAVGAVRDAVNVKLGKIGRKVKLIGKKVHQIVYSVGSVMKGNMILIEVSRTG
jgi:hypothetical protein